MGTLYVNPATGNDSATGGESTPLKTITGAISKAQADDTIKLASGTYNSTSGESFPLKVPAGVKIVGNESDKGKNILIEGGGSFVSPSSALQNIAISLANNTELRGVTVTNTERRGTGVWLESTNPTIANCTFTKCNREGVQAVGTAAPQILDNFFVANLGQGITYRDTSAGEAKGNTCEDMASGIDVGDQATPLLTSNTVSGNRFGMTIFSDAKPTLRSNLIENNTDDGLSVSGRALPDLGTSGEPGKNAFNNNGKFDINNNTSNQLVSIGNSFTVAKINGDVQLTDNIADGGDAGSGDNTGGGTGGGDTGGGDTGTGGGDTGGGDTGTGGGDTGGGDTGTGGGDTGGGDTGGGDTGTGGGTVVEFPDIKDNWAEGFIRALLAEKIVSGYGDGTFKPNDKVTRAQYAALLVQAFNPQAKRAATTFKDVDSDYWAAEVIQKAYRGGFLSGYPNGNFKPSDPIKRADVIVSLVNGLGLSDTNNDALSVYDDRSTVPTYAVDAVKTATMKNMVVNYPLLKRLRPTEATTRGELAAMVFQALVDQGKFAALPSPYIVSYTGGDTSFPDVAGHWGVKFIEGLYGKGLITGYPDGKFKPDAAITRAQYAALLDKAFDLTPKREAVKFKDVSDGFWAAEVIQKAYRAGFLSGFPDGTFKPNENTQRVQILVSLVNGLGLSASGSVDGYTDKGSIPDYGKDEVATATAKGIVVNYPDLKKLQPTKAATRAEVSAFVYQALVDSGQLAAVDSNYIVSA